jgi:dTMP kinase
MSASGYSFYFKESDMFIAIDGIDGSGKGTQTDLLHKYLVKMGKSVDLISFPQYQSFFGAMVGEYLNGKYGTLEQVNPKLAALLFAMDRKNFFERNTPEADVVLFNRYVSSNIGHQTGRVAPDEQDQFNDWLEELEYGINGIPRPDLSIIFDISVETSLRQVAMKGKRDYTNLTHDIHEQDKVYLHKVRDYFHSLGSRDDYEIVSCEDSQGEVLSIPVIFEKVKALVEPYLA